MNTAKKISKSLLLTLLLLLSICAALAALPNKVQAAETLRCCNLVIFVRFGDDNADIYNLNQNWTKINKLYNQTDNPDTSFKNYIYTISEGKLTVDNYFPQATTGAVNTFTLSYEQSHYTDDWEIITEVIDAMDSGAIPIDTSANKLDNFHSGTLDNLTLIIQGDSSDRNAILYPHKSSYAGSSTISGISVYNYNILNSAVLVDADGAEYYYSNKGTIAHEFMHSLGFPDLYRYTAPGTPVGGWDIMAQTSSFQQYPLSYLRHTMGWLDMPEITVDGNYTLNAVSASSNGTKLFKITTPLSDSEFFVIEYRVKKDSYTGDFETKIPSGGLLIYRVDNSVSDRTNRDGDNYIYVFRPNATSVNGAEETYATDYGSRTSTDLSAIDPGASETSYGSTDLDKSYTQNTIYYSDGLNSGVEISNVTLSADGEQISFDIDFADYSEADLWDKLGGGLNATAYYDTSIAVSEQTGYVYTAFTLNSGATSTDVEAHMYNGLAWAKLGYSISGADSPQICCFNGDVYLSCMQNSKPAFYKLVSGNWSLIRSDSVTYPEYMGFFEGNGVLYNYYVKDGTTLIIQNTVTGAVLSESLTAGYLTEPKLCFMNNAVYAVYCDFYAAGTDNQTKIAKYDFATGTWSTVKQLNINLTNTHAITTDGTNLYVACGGFQKQPKYASFDGTSWNEETLSFITQETSYGDITLAVNNANVYFGYTDNTANVLKVMRRGDLGWEQFGANVDANTSDFSLSSSGNYLYAAFINTANNTVLVKYKATVQQQNDYNVTLTPPAGYTDAKIYFDGYECNATEISGSYTATPNTSTTKTAVMYKYNESGIPIGMYVWKLNFVNGRYAVTEMPEFTDLLSYHGFSVRVTGVSGIRFKSGIAITTRNALTSSQGLNGYKLAEYGTLVMTNANRFQLPLVLGGQKVLPGRAYWTENNITNDKIFETVDGRYRFTSVLVNLPASQYKTDFAFRSYAIVTTDSETFTLYGPIVYRSIYTVAGQVIAKGEFTPNSPADLFLRNIIRTAL